MKRRASPWLVARMRRTLEEIALLCAAFEAKQLTAERVAYEAGCLAVGVLQGPWGRRR